MMTSESNFNEIKLFVNQNLSNDELTTDNIF